MLFAAFARHSTVFLFIKQIIPFAFHLFLNGKTYLALQHVFETHLEAKILITFLHFMDWNIKIKAKEKGYTNLTKLSAFAEVLHSSILFLISSDTLPNFPRTMFSA